MINSVIRTRKKEVKNNKKKVLLVINCLQGGGAERVVLTLGQGFYDWVMKYIFYGLSPV